MLNFKKYVVLGSILGSFLSAHTAIAMDPETFTERASSPTLRSSLLPEITVYWDELNESHQAVFSLNEDGGYQVKEVFNIQKSLVNDQIIRPYSLQEPIITLRADVPTVSHLKSVISYVLGYYDIPNSPILFQAGAQPDDSTPLTNNTRYSMLLSRR